jgi:hypothetical protein
VDEVSLDLPERHEALRRQQRNVSLMVSLVLPAVTFVTEYPPSPRNPIQEFGSEPLGRDNLLKSRCPTRDQLDSGHVSESKHNLTHLFAIVAAVSNDQMN